MRNVGQVKEGSALVLYVAGSGRESELCVVSAREVASRWGGLALDIVDILADPARAEAANILSAPTLVLSRPGSARTVAVTGDLAEPVEVARRLGLSSRGPDAEGDRVDVSDATLANGLVVENPDGIVVADAAGTIVFLNDAAERLFRRSREEVLGTSLQFRAPADGPAELDVVVAGADLHTVELRTAPTTWKGAPAVLATLRDVTERKKAEAMVVGLAAELSSRNTDLQELVGRLEEDQVELARSNEDLETFAAVVSHDLKSPLSVLSGAAQTLLQIEGARLSDPGKQLCDAIVRSALRMSTMLDGLLERARAGAIPTSAPVDCAALVRDVLALLSPRFDAIDATVDIGDLPVVMGDALQLGEVFQNLLINAIKYRSSARPLRVRVSARRAGADLIFSVDDNGIGIDPADRERVFDRATRLDGGKSLATGHGLGLSICRRVVERHGGRIWVEGTATGTSFHFTLPA